MTEQEAARRAAPLLARVLARVTEQDLVTAAETLGVSPPCAGSAAITAPGSSPARPPVGSGAASP